MCGITGHVNWNKDVRADRQMLEKMTETLSHRGPDETDTWMNQHVAFGHKRLSVIDIEGGKQPMQKVKNGDTYTLVYNGELYNTEELRNELYRKGYRNPQTLELRWWIWVPAAIMVFLLMLAVRNVGEALKRATDARQRRG